MLLFEIQHFGIYHKFYVIFGVGYAVGAGAEYFFIFKVNNIFLTVCSCLQIYFFTKPFVQDNLQKVILNFYFSDFI